MQTLKYHHLLNISVNHFIKNIEVIPKLPKNTDIFVSKCDTKLFLHEGVYSKLSELDRLSSLMFFMTPESDKKNIHVDYKTNNFTLLNVLKPHGIENKNTEKEKIVLSMGFKNHAYSTMREMHYKGELLNGVI